MGKSPSDRARNPLDMVQDQEFHQFIHHPSLSQWEALVSSFEL